jgi:hypothetical protein
LLELEIDGFPLQYAERQVDDFTRLVGADGADGDHVLGAERAPDEVEALEGADLAGGERLDGHNRLARVADDPRDPVDLDLHQEAHRVIERNIGFDIDPRFVGVDEGFGHVRAEAGDHAALPDFGEQGLDVPDFAGTAIDQRVGGALVGETESRPEFELGIENGVDLAFVESPGGDVFVDGEEGGGDDESLDAGAVLGFPDGIGEGLKIDQAHDGIDAGLEKDLEDIGDGVALADVLLDVGILGGGRMAEAEKPIGADDQAGDGDATDCGAGKRGHGFTFRKTTGFENSRFQDGFHAKKIPLKIIAGWDKKGFDTFFTTERGPRMKSGRLISIEVVRSDPVLEGVAQEAARYVERMTGRRPVRRRAGRAADGCAGRIQLGWIESFPELCDRSDPRPPDLFADRLVVRAGGGRVVLAGSNSRSVWYALYRWLEELGCRWLRPGPMGETVPRLAAPLARRVRLNETPSYRHRCICIEGSCSRRHVLDMLDYAVKRGFNAYFLQFRNSYTFFDHWYREERQAGGPPVPFSVAEAEAIHREVKAAALRRGMVLHMVGHGWTCEPFGIAGTEWRPTTQSVPAPVRRSLAQVKGRRELWGGIPLNTQLCYAQSSVRRLMARAVVDYARAHPEEQVIHVWLADGANNNCECAACRKHRPSDLYVDLLNEIDRGLTAHGLATRIVFLAYVDLLWAPVRARIRNPARFILMFAPITRTYSRPFGAAGPAGRPERVGAYERNRLVFPTSPEANLRLLRGWRRAFKGEQVDFDYHLWRDWVLDPGQMQISRVIHADVVGLARFGMSGYISCQAQRLAFPTGFPLHVLGKTLWNARASFDALARAYFRDLYGGAGDRIRRVQEEVSRRIDPAYLRGEKKRPIDQRRAARAYAELARWIRRQAPVLNGVTGPGIERQYSRRILGRYVGYVAALADLYAQVVRREGAATDALARFERGLEEHLMELHPVLDTWMVGAMVRHVVASAGLPVRDRIWINR